MSQSLQIAGHKFIVKEFIGFTLLHSDSVPTPCLVIGEKIWQSEIENIEEVIVAESEICLKLKGEIDLSVLTDINIESESRLQADSMIWPICFEINGEWELITKQSGLDKQQFISILCQNEYTPAMFGFTPGFVYLSGLSDQLHLARKTTPSNKVYSGDVGIGGKYLGMYGISSPGGWHIIGNSPIKFYDLDKIPPLLIGAQSKLKIETVSTNKYKALLERNITIIDYNA